MNKSKTLKEIALELLEKYRLSEERGIYEYSGFIKADLASLETECDDIRKQIEEFAEPKWTSVLERLPDTYTTVLVSDGKQIWTDSLEDDFDRDGDYIVWWESFGFGDPVGFYNTAWIPLPEPYEEAEK